MSKLIASTLEAAAAVEELQHTIDELHGKTVDLGVDTAAANAAAAVNDLANAEFKANAAGQMQMETTRLLAESDAMLADQDERLTAVYADRAHNAALLIGAEEALNGTNREAASSLILVADAGTRVAAAGNAAWRPWFLFGANWATALHWIVAGGAELLSVTVPAMVALGAGMFVALQGAVNMASHMQALYDTLEAVGPSLNKTMGDVLGLGHSFQAAQDAANPGVYEILGSAINDAKTSFQGLATVGLQVVHMFDEFAARVTVDLKNGMGNEVSSLLADMIPDLQRLGQVFANLGHAVLNFAAAMPGLAQLLLLIADGASRAILAFSSMPAGIITAAMAMEEFFRWGGLVLGMLAKLAGGGELMAAFGATNFITKFGAALLALVAQGGSFIAWVGTLVGRLAGVVPAAEEAGTALVGMGGDLRVAALEMSPLMASGIAAVVAGIAIAIVAFAHIKDATDNWVAATDKAVASASDLNVIGVAAKTLAENSLRLGDANQKLAGQMKDAGTQAGNLTARFGSGNGILERSAQDVADLTQQQQHLLTTMSTVGQNAQFLGSQFHVSASAALELANAAGVNLQQGLLKGTQAGQIAVQMINNLKAGLGAMAAPAGIIGGDMEALGVQSQLAGTKVQQVNQAIDQFTASAVAGTSTWAAFRISLQGVSQGALQLGGASLTAANNWQKFDGAVTSGNAMLDTLRTGMAEGVVSANTYTGAVRDTVAQLLLFAGHNKTAVAEASTLAQEIGGPDTNSFKTLAQWAGITGQKAGPELAAAMAKASTAMSNLGTVAKNLSAVVGQQVDNAFAAAITGASGLKGALNNMETAMHSGASTSGLFHTSLTKVIGDLSAMHESVPTITSLLQQAGVQINQAGVKAVLAGGQMKTMGGDAATAGSSALAAAGHVRTLGGAMTIAGNQAAAARGQVDALQAAINSLHSKTITITTLVNTINNESIIEHVTKQAGALQHGGVIPGFQPGVDSVHAMLSPGEGVLNPYAVRMLGAGWVHAVNRIAESGGSVNPAALRAGVSGPGAGGGAGVIHNHIILDGREIATSVRRIEYSWQTRNSGTRSGLSIPGTRVG
jgi:hypothetical protein